MKPPPGLTRTSTEQEKLDTALAAKPGDYVPRTHLKDGGKPRYTNRLIFEASPYLLQHAHNPVDWWPWGDAALAEAKRRDVPIFLSAGYATCHWCHVMEEESFDNEEVADLLNKNFVAVKLDREQRPDVDQVYITATSLQHRHAGWPNSVWMLPDGRPFHTGTYFRKPHFMQVLNAIAHQWSGDKRTEFERFAASLSEAVNTALSRPKPEADVSNAASDAAEHLAQTYNPVNGGFSTGQQFPHEGNILFLLDRYRRTGDADILEIATNSLEHMTAGGFHDHVGGGFHRYTVDENWRTPHFEKMLYNQALLIRCYSEAFELTSNPRFQRTVERLVRYLGRDLSAHDGAFYTAEDADSLDASGKLEEGAFYVWPPEEARDILADPATVTLLGLTEPPTIEAGPIAHLKPHQDFDAEALDAELERLRLARDSRPRPLRDEKIITGWNGLMIRGLAQAAATFDRPDWRGMAEAAAKSVIERLETPDGLRRIHGGGIALEQANLSDYVWLAQGCLAIFDAGGADSWRAKAEDLTTTALEAFAVDQGRLALTQDGPLGPVLELEDGAIPSGESSMLELITDLSQRDGSDVWDARARMLLNALSGHLAEMPVARLVAVTAAEKLIKGDSGLHRHLQRGRAQVALRRSAGWILTFNLEQDVYIETATLKTRGISFDTALPDTLTGKQALPVTLTEPEIGLNIQLCTDRLCFATEDVVFRVSP